MNVFSFPLFWIAAMILQLKSEDYMRFQEFTRDALSYLLYDEDIESMNERRMPRRGNERLRSTPDFGNIPLKGARVDDQDGRSFGTLLL
jgi:hypothetical protein